MRAALAGARGGSRERIGGGVVGPECGGPEVPGALVRVALVDQPLRERRVDGSPLARVGRVVHG